MTLTGNNVITLRKLTSKVTAEKGIPLKFIDIFKKFNFSIPNIMYIKQHFKNYVLCLLCFWAVTSQMKSRKTEVKTFQKFRCSFLQSGVDLSKTLSYVMYSTGYLITISSGHVLIKIYHMSHMIDFAVLDLRT